ncbi:MAG: polymer-forming cytoskeletal protein [Polyangiales bacterium]
MLDLDKTEPGTKQTTIEEGTKFTGTLESTCQVVVRGEVDGELNAPTLVIAETGTVVGNVRAQSIQSSGVLAGRVDADDIFLSGRVRSDTVIRAKTMEVKLQSNKQKLEITFGECILDVGEDPSKDVRVGAIDETTSAVSTAVPATSAAEPVSAPASGGGGKKSARRGGEAAPSEGSDANRGNKADGNVAPS